MIIESKVGGIENYELGITLRLRVVGFLREIPNDELPSSRVKVNFYRNDNGEEKLGSMENWDTIEEILINELPPPKLEVNLDEENIKKFWWIGRDFIIANYQWYTNWWLTILRNEDELWLDYEERDMINKNHGVRR